MTTGGDIIYGGGSGAPTRLANGTAGQVLQSNGTTLAPSWATLTGMSFANPTGSVGLTAVNGSAATWMRSDAAPALNVGIIPTWTGAHTWSALGTFNLGLNASGAAINLNASSNFDTNINTGTSTGAVHIADGGTGGNAITIGNTASSTGITARVGTGNLAWMAVAGSTYAIGASTTTGTITIGGTSMTTGNTTINGGTGTGAISLTPGTAGTIVIGAAAGTGAITVGSRAGRDRQHRFGEYDGNRYRQHWNRDGYNAKNINIRNGAITTTNIATGNFANTVVIGNSNGWISFHNYNTCRNWWPESG